MSPTAISQASHASRPVHSRRKTIMQWMDAHAFALNVFTLSVLLLLCVSYILQVTSTVANGYELRDLEVQVNELGLHNEQLQVATRKAQSLEHVHKSLTMLGLVPSEQPVYVDQKGPSYALAE